MQLKNFFILLCVVHFSFGAKALVTEWESNLPENSQFNVSKTMKARVDFWKRIYAEVSESEGLFHNVDDPGIVYSKIDLSNIKKSKHMNASQKAKSISKLIDDERLRIAKKHKIKNIKTIRLQMGLKERMQKALFVSGKYLPMMEDVFEKKGLPLELTRLVFVESSFNIRAQSKVGASGLWQIMPFVAKPEGYIKEYYDKRNHPYYATLLAADILATNHKSLKRWPLAITAYNHGLTGVRRMAAMNETEDISKLIQTTKKTRTWGFASSNFYACFLAVLEVEREAQS
ncbi:MAG: transglycosylase SLT domain-containing protein, partial [Pseudobdellovibrio sp.]